jgi:hypothetical protein
MRQKQINIFKKKLFGRFHGAYTMDGHRTALGVIGDLELEAACLVALAPRAR